MGFLDKLLGRRPAEASPAHAPPRTQQLTKVGYLSFDEQRDDAVLEIVGELSYQDAIREAIRSRPGVGPHAPFTAAVLPEPTNRYDPNALSVILLHGDGQTAAVVGYLSRENGVAYRPVMRHIAPRVILTSAILKGGRAEPIIYGATLALGSPSELLAEIFMSTYSAPPPHRWTGKTVCFTGPSHHGVLGVQLDRHGQEYLARKAGCSTWPRATKKVDVCVASSIDSETGKLGKAEEYGIEVAREADFWPGVGLRLERW